ncbi:hypothetical protein TrLO_g5202 [Triparma laevis f. longispina]|uniref:Acyltransferase 3 domain-containing protein n=1 Tax=Triparma laevis f. longispina TaxID=1714387 RepID=A0A9W7E452_9STRA|nr:hypothetical protein TrLO_g5202 [Triparma laevis f. longispina]
MGAPAPRQRVYAIDWLRMYDVFIVIMGHCIRFLDDKASDVKLSGAGSNSYLNVIMLFGNMWVMPLFFFLAGAAANLSISSRTRMMSYFVKRVLRIGIPLVGGFFLAVLPYAYITRDYLDCNESGISDENMSDIPPVFFAYFFQNCFAKHGFKWLWFLALLAMMTGLHLPIIFYLKRSVLTDNVETKKLLQKKIMLTGCCYMLGWGLFCSLALPIHSFLNFGGLVLYFTVTFGHVYVQHVRKQDSSYVLLLLFMMSTHLFIQAEDKAETNTLTKWLFIVISYINMFLSGFLISLYEAPIARAFTRKRGYLVLTLFNFALFPLLAPVYEDSPDYDFVNGGVYATYPKVDMRILYGAGSYTWVIFIYAFARKFLNHEFNSLAYAYFTRSTLPLYIIHPTIQYALAIYWYIPYGQHYPSGITFTTMCGLSFFLCFAFYTLIDVTPFRFLVGLSGPSPLFPEGLFKPSPLFSDGVKFCKPRCGMTEKWNCCKDEEGGDEDEDDDGGKSFATAAGGVTKEEDDNLPLANPGAGSQRDTMGHVTNAVSEVFYGKYGLNAMTKFDLVGDKLRHLVEDEEHDLGYDGASQMIRERVASSDDDDIDHWAVPSTETWRTVLRENRRLQERVRLLESTCDEHGIEVEVVEELKKKGENKVDTLIEMSRSL